MKAAVLAATTVAVVALISGCGGSGHSPSVRLPSAQTVAKKLGCQTEGPNTTGDVPLEYVRQDISLNISTACPADFIVTFSSVANENRWLDAYNNMSRQGAIYMVVGHLWAVDQATFVSPANTHMIESKLGGRSWSGGT